MFNWIRSLPIIRNHLAVRQLIKFTISGGIFTIVDFGVYIFLTRLFAFWYDHYLWANLISIGFSATGNYFVNKNWTFRSCEKNFSQYIKFWVVVLIGVAAYQYLLLVLVEKVLMYDLLAKVLTASVVMFLRFLLQKFWVFR